jgi:L-rhamnose-H+ transport protein
MLSWAGVVLAGLLNGSFAVPLKTTRVWKFNHIWTLHSLLAMGVLPWVVVMVAVPRWNDLLSRVDLRGWLILIGWGVLFGIASLLYGIAVDLLGIALGFAIQLGLSIVLGALLPLLWAGAFELRSRGDWVFILGLALMVVGVVFCAQAGGSKGKAGGSTARRFRLGLIIAIIGGVLAPTLNFGIQYGTALLSKGVEARSKPGFPVEIYLAWAVFLSSAAVVQAGYCFARVVREHSTGIFAAGMLTRDALEVPAMSLLWISSVFIYGRSAFGLGPLGNSFGWPVFVALIILTSNAWGVLLAEWKQASRAAFFRMIAGSAVLIVAAFLIGQGKRG